MVSMYALHMGLHAYPWDQGAVLARNSKEAVRLATEWGWIEEPHVWVSTTSHRSRERLEMLFRIAREDGPGPAYGSWPQGGALHGSYYRVPARHAEAIGRIQGARVLRAEPKDLFRRWTHVEMGGPVPAVR
jgi:hypothetical protein